MKYVKDEVFTRYLNGDFCRKFYWNVQELTKDSKIKSGYIVQHIIRKTIDSKKLYTNNDNYNHDYWEAWIVKNNKIMLDSNDFHDCWKPPLNSISANAYECDLKEHGIERVNSNGTIYMEGHVYWAPLGSP